LSTCCNTLSRRCDTFSGYCGASSGRCDAFSGCCSAVSGCCSTRAAIQQVTPSHLLNKLPRSAGLTKNQFPLVFSGGNP
jgi:hypothetical protein